MYKIYGYIYLLLPKAKPPSSLCGNHWCFSPPPPFFFSSFSLCIVLGSSFKSSSPFMCAERTLHSSPIVTTTASCKLITTGFIVFVVHRVIESFLLLLLLCDRTEMWRRKWRRSYRSSSSLKAGIFTIHRRSPPLLYEPYQANNVKIRANEITIHSCLHTKHFFSTFNRSLISTTCLVPPDTYGTKMMNQMNLRETNWIPRIDSWRVEFGMMCKQRNVWLVVQFFLIIDMTTPQ